MIDLKLLCRILEDTSTSCEHMGCREPSHSKPAKLDGDGDGMRKGVGMRVGSVPREVWEERRGSRRVRGADPEEEEEPRAMTVDDVDNPAPITPNKTKLKTKIDRVGNVCCCCSCET